MEHKVGDWRRGKSWREIIEGTREGGRNGEYLEWRKLREEDIKIGEEGEEALTEEAKDLYLRLIFAYYEIVAENPKKPGIIPGIYHRILLKDDARPCRERVRGGAPGEELIREEEAKMLLKNDIVEE